MAQQARKFKNMIFEACVVEPRWMVPRRGV